MTGLDPAIHERCMDAQIKSALTRELARASSPLLCDVDSNLAKLP